MKIYLSFLFFLIMNLAFSQTQSFDIQGHRGCRGLMPENTIPAFLKALEYGVTTLELDVVVSKDGQVVVSHEPYFNPDITTTPDGKQLPKGSKINIYQLNYAEIKQYDCGIRGNFAFPKQQKIRTYKPLLRDVFDEVELYCKKHQIKSINYNIEIKSDASEYDTFQPQPAVFSDLVHAIIKTYLKPERVTIQSFDFNVLKHWNLQIKNGNYLKVSLAALVSNLKGIDTNLESLGFRPDIYSPFYKLLSSDKVTQLHKQGIKVIPWTVNTLSEMQQIKAMGVDGLITDYPDRAQALR
jgi:glycerophosphoryl diester phosphodiesterase